MAEEFRLPDIGEGLTEAEIVRWHVPVGGAVAVDQTVVEIETDKAVFEIPSPYGGVVLRHGGEPGETIAVGEVLVVVGEPGEALGGTLAAVARPRPATADAAPIVGTLTEEAHDLTPVPQRSPAGHARVRATPGVRRLARDLGVDLAALTPTGPAGRVTREDVLAGSGRSAGNGQRSLSPVVRRLATDLAVDLDAVVGTGPGGRITRRDVTAAAGRQPAAAPGGVRRRPLSKLRRTIAARMSESWAEIPHVTAFDDVDATRLLDVRRALQARHGVAIPVDALVVAAVVPALRAHPEMNASLDGDDLVLHERHDIGVAVDTADGLLVAVIRDAGSRDLLGLATEVRRLGDLGRARGLTPADLSGQTFTVSNIGAVGGGHGTPIVPRGTVGILSVGRAIERPVARDGRVEVAPVMPLSLSYDHRVIDGAAGRRFLATVVENLAEPALFLA